MARRALLPDKGEDATGVPDWKWYDEENAKCVCVIFNPRRLSSRSDWEDAKHTTADWDVRANGCRYYLRRGGCKFGDDCTYCHVHPINPHSPDWSQRIHDPVTGNVRKMHRHERVEQRHNRTEQEVSGQEAYRMQLKAIDQDWVNYYNFGEPVHGCHIAFWTIHRLLSLAKESAQDTARKLSADGVTEKKVGIWLGVDKLCLGDYHYPLGEAHGVHTLMKGWATRLQQLVHDSTAQDFLLFEADARVVRNLSGHLGHVLALLRQDAQPFCWVGFFTDAKRNHEGKWQWTYNSPEEARAAGGHYNAGAWANWPFKFRGNCQGKTIPKDGCQGLYIRKDFVRTFCERLLAYETPMGLDMALFDPDLLNDKELAFTSVSLAGQKPGMSDSWGNVNMKAGEMTEPNMQSLVIRRFADSEVLVQKRKQKWTWIQELNEKQKKTKKFKLSPSFNHWRFPFVKVDAPEIDDPPNSVSAASSAGAAPKAPMELRDGPRYPWSLLDMPPARAVPIGDGDDARSRSPPPRRSSVPLTSKYPSPTPPTTRGR